jgi:hypothetical protein
VAKAAKKLITAKVAAQGEKEQLYADLEGRRPPYFGEREPTAWSATTHFRSESGVRADANRGRFISLDGPPPPTGKEWLESAAKRMKARPDHPDQITQAAQQLESEMHEGVHTPTVR